MRTRKSWPVAATLLAAGTLIALALPGQGQPPSPPPAGTGAAPPFPTKPPAAPAGPDLTRLPLGQQLLYVAAREGKDWLVRANRPNGRFTYGIVPSLRVALSGDNFAHQAAAAFALARSAAFFKDERVAAVARQALLTLLLETEKDVKNPQVRYPATAGVSPLAAASWLVLAINELPAPGADLLQKSEELCLYLRVQQQKDGSVRLGSSGDESSPAIKNRAAQAAAGLALYALTRSLRHRNEPWKLEMVRTARDYYMAAWRGDRSTELVPWLSAACAEAFLLTKEATYAQNAAELSDWLLALQYKDAPSPRQHWNGGFKKWEQGKAVPELPDVHDAVYMEGLGQCCRVARQRGELQQFQSYRKSVEQCCQFLLSLQYNENNALHFEPGYRRDFLLGGFHATHQDGTLRIDYTQEAVCALVKYLADVAEVK